jgi:hypothetical protein
MAEFKLGRIRFVWKGDWNTATTYYQDDVVSVGGKTFICVVGHTSAASFYTDLDIVPTKWNQMSDGQAWTGDWNTNTYYKINDVVKYGGQLYIADTAHTSAATASLGLEADQASWTIYAEGFDWKNLWTISTRYKVNDLVRYGGYTYVCNTGHTSTSSASSGLEADQAKWDTFNPGVDYKGEWASVTRYKLNDIVKYGAGLWICITQHTSSAAFETDNANWSQFVEGFEYANVWSSATDYKAGDVVEYGGNKYVASTNHTNKNPVTDTSDWALFSKGFSFQSDWNIATSYKISQVVRLNAYTYLATTDVPSFALTVTASSASNNRFTTSSTTGLVANMAVRFTGTTFGDVFTGATYYIKTISSATEFTISTTPGGTEFVPTTASGTMTATIAPHPTNASYYATLNKGISWQGEWTDDVEYELGDAVKFGANAFICIQRHRSEGDDGSSIKADGGGAANSRPDLDSAGAYWNQLITGSEVSILTTPGDLVYYGGAGATRLPIGIEGQVLQAGPEYPAWVSLGSSDHVYYVGPTGSDGVYPVRGATIDKPFASIRYALEQIENGPRNKNAQRLLEMNRVFIQREVTEWIDYQVNNAAIGSIWENFSYDDFKCFRDIGYVIDRLIWDIGHGGNLKIRAAALALVGELGASGEFSAASEDVAYDGLSSEAPQSILAYGYMVSLIGNVLNQTAPAVNYQVTNGDNSTAVVSQHVESEITAENVLPIVTSLVTIIQNAIEDGDSTRIPARDVPNNTLKVKTGRYSEVLPMIVTENTVVFGDAKRSVTVGPAAASTHITDVKYSVETFGHLASVVSSIVTGATVTPTTGNTVSQDIAVPFADTAEATTTGKLMSMLALQTDYKTNAMAMARLTDPTGYNISYLAGYGNARKLLKENKAFLQEEVISYLAANYPTARYGKTLTRRDTGYIVDALLYDLTYGGNALSVQTGLAYWDGDDNTLPQIPASIKALTLDAQAFLRDLMIDVAGNTTVTPLNSTIPQFRGTAGSAGALTLIEDNVNEIIDIVDNGPAAASLTDSTPANGVNTTTALIAAYSDLDTNSATIRSSTISWINSNFPTLVYNSAKCSRDIGIILKAIGFDFMYDTNYQTLKAAMAYLRPTASEVYTLNQKAVTRAAIQYALKTLAVANVNSDATAIARVNISADIIDNTIFGATNDGSVCQTDQKNLDFAVLQLERNRDFILAETTAYIDEYYSDTATATIASDNSITISDTSWLQRNTAIRFSGTIFGEPSGPAADDGIVSGTTYFVQDILSSTKFTVALTRNATTAYTMVDDTGSMTVSLFYNEALCLRDTNKVIDAVKFDLKYPGNYKTRFAARYYANAVTGSREEDMYYMRNGTGLRNQTFVDLNGDLTPANEYGTSRVTAGAYASLDPGWGPDDFRTWIISRSPYLQNCAMFGNAAIGQKIDGALHNGGNQSMVSNDFTQLISDGIGSWVTNNGRAELVSVFSYYSHVGYLAENGGRIRGTNGNNSYGDFGSVAEGFDDTETVNSAIVDNKFQFEATVGTVNTDGATQVYNFEFNNAGNDYTEATWLVSGAGLGARAVADEFRDGAVFQVHLPDNVDDSATAPEAAGNFGGFGYITNSNTAQAGSSTTITIAATDSEISAAYVGMKVYVTGGTGVGQYGIINSYNAGTKIAAVIKESTGASGWDHLVPGTTITSPDASSTYKIEPRLSFTSPGFSSTVGTISSSGTWNDAIFGSLTGVFVITSGYTYAGTGTGASFQVIKNGGKYVTSIVSGGTGYTRLETITISGTDLGGQTPTNDIVITITSVNANTGAISVIESEGWGFEGRWVAVRNGTAGAYSDNGSDWTGTTMPSGNWSAITHALIDDGSSISKQSRFVAIATGGISAAYSDDGVIWASASLPTSAAWSDVTYDVLNETFVAIASNSTVSARSLDGQVWDLTGTLNSTGFTKITYGKERVVALKFGTNVVSYSTDGGLTFTDTTLPATSDWTGITWGNGKFVAVASDSDNGAYSLDGQTWAAMTVGSPDSTTPAGLQKVEYGQGLFIATAALSGEDAEGYSYVATSTDGINWTWNGVDELTSPGLGGWNVVAFGLSNRKGYYVALPLVSSNVAVRIRTGATTTARAYVSENKIFAIRIVEPGSGYDSAPTLTVTDPSVIFTAPTLVRLGNGVLANPTFGSRGTGYVTGSADLDTGNGFGDFLQSGSFIAVRRLTQIPVTGSNVNFAHLPNRTFKLVNVLTRLGTEDGSYTAFFQISPNMSLFDTPAHATALTTRIRYSQVRLTGHDFLDIGTGGFTSTNYPLLPSRDPNPANETVESNGGRVFFTSTDQDGNFRVGGLFAIEQSTGVATLNADAFNISGLQELSLGEVTLGGGSASITEFSTDPFFTSDSDTVVPTQRAIKAYISSQIGGGGASLNVNSVTAGFIFIAGTQITTTTSSSISVNANMNFKGGVVGLPVAWNYFLT